jgi:serine/threonine protein kinase
LRPSNVIINVYLDRAVKVCDSASTAPDAVYEALASGNLPIRIGITRNSPSAGKSTIVTSPGCSQTLPFNIKELIYALWSITYFLTWFHSLGFVHRDIRWPNILRTGSGRWALIDFEIAAQDGASAPQDSQLALEKRPPECANPGSFYSSAGDIWQVGMLVEAWMDKISYIIGMPIIPEPLAQLVTTMVGRKDERPTAKDACARLFELNRSF